MQINRIVEFLPVGKHVTEANVGTIRAFFDPEKIIEAFESGAIDRITVSMGNNCGDIIFERNADGNDD